jgi:hypothetical protein
MHYPITSVIDLHDFVQRHSRLSVLTGAGVSAESGIAAYRDEHGNWNRGRTRADHLFTLKVEHGCGEVLTDLVETLSAVPSPAPALEATPYPHADFGRGTHGDRISLDGG